MNVIKWLLSDLMKAADVQPVKRGRWIYRETKVDSFPNYHCSICGREAYIDLFDFCPRCGADMRGEENAESNR